MLPELSKGGQLSSGKSLDDRAGSPGDGNTASATCYEMYPHFCWARCQQTGRFWWSATGGPAPDVASPLSGLKLRCSLHGSQLQRPSSGLGSGSPVRCKAAEREIQSAVRGEKKSSPDQKWAEPTCIVNGVSFFLFMVLSSMVSGTDRLIILLCKRTKTNTTFCHFM